VLSPRFVMSGNLSPCVGMGCSYNANRNDTDHFPFCSPYCKANQQPQQHPSYAQAHGFYRQQCAYPHCTKPVHSDHIDRSAYCSKAHARDAGQTSIPQCIKCGQNAWREPSGGYSKHCGNTCRLSDPR